jgi:hypothetical protein
MKNGEGLLGIEVVDYTNPVKFYLGSTIEENIITINWGDGTIEEVTIPIGFNTLKTHSYTSNKLYTITFSNATNLAGLANLDISFPEIPINKIKSVTINKLTNLEYLGFLYTNLTSLDISGLNKLTKLVVNNAKLSTEAVNNILVTFNNFETMSPIGDAGIVLNQQNPPAAPSGVGLTAKTELQARNWNVITDP